MAELREAGASHGGGVDLSARGEAHGGAAALGLGRTEWMAMQASADAMRGLVRIKISDDNDIKAARCALEIVPGWHDSAAVDKRDDDDDDGRARRRDHD